MAPHRHHPHRDTAAPGLAGGYGTDLPRRHRHGPKRHTQSWVWRSNPTVGKLGAAVFRCRILGQSVPIRVNLYDNYPRLRKDTPQHPLSVRRETCNEPSKIQPTGRVLDAL